MAQIKTSELTAAALDWAVAKCNDVLKDATQARNFLELCKQRSGVALTHGRTYTPSTDWSQGGPIIELEGLCLIKTDTVWQCTTNGNELHSHAKQGPSPLIAAMRCYVASKLGDVVEVPDQLTK